MGGSDRGINALELVIKNKNIALAAILEWCRLLLETWFKKSGGWGSSMLACRRNSIHEQVGSCRNV